MRRCEHSPLGDDILSEAKGSFREILRLRGIYLELVEELRCRMTAPRSFSVAVALT